MYKNSTKYNISFVCILASILSFYSCDYNKILDIAPKIEISNQKGSYVFNLGETNYDLSNSIQISDFSLSLDSVSYTSPPTAIKVPIKTSLKFPQGQFEKEFGIIQDLDLINHKIDGGKIKLNEILLEEGRARLEIKYSSTSELEVKVTSDHIKNISNDPFSMAITLPATNKETILFEEIDLRSYSFLPDKNGNIKFKTESILMLEAGKGDKEKLNYSFNMSFTNLSESYIKGFFGTDVVLKNLPYTVINTPDLSKSQDIIIGEASKIKVYITNELGIPIALDFSGITFETKSGEVMNLDYTGGENGSSIVEIGKPQFSTTEKKIAISELELTEKNSRIIEILSRKDLSTMKISPKIIINKGIAEGSNNSENFLIKGRYNLDINFKADVIISFRKKLLD